MATSDSLYIKFRAKADELLRRFGTQFDIVSQGYYDEETLTSVEGETTTAWGVLTNDKAVLQTIAGDTGGTWTATKTLILSAERDYLPTDQVKVEGRNYSLSNLETIKPADITVVYLLDVS